LEKVTGLPRRSLFLGHMAYSSRSIPAVPSLPVKAAAFFEAA
jgi:hypothetical protein